MKRARAKAKPAAVVPGAVVVDTRDGFTWAKDSAGQPFTPAAAREMAAKFNGEMQPEHRTFKVYRLVADFPDTDCPGTGGPWGATGRAVAICPVCGKYPWDFGVGLHPLTHNGRFTGKVPQHGKPGR